VRILASTFPARLAAAAGSRRGRALLGSAAGLLLLYAIVGFFVVPPLLEQKLEEKLSEALQRPVSIEAVRVNPFAPSVTLQGLAVRERQADATFAAFDELYVNVAWTSLLRFAPVLDEIRLAKPSLRLVREADGRYNFQDLLERPRSPAGDGEEGGVPRFALFNVQLVDGRVDFDDRAKGERHELTELRLGIPHLSSLPAHAEVKVSPELSMKLNGAPFALRGEALPFDPARPTRLSLDVDGFDLTRIVSYLPAQPRAKLASALLDTRLTVAFEQAASGPRLVLGGVAALRDLALRDGKERPVIGWRRLDVELDEVEPLARRVHLKRIALEGAELHVRRDGGGALNLAELGPAPAAAPNDAAAGAADGPNVLLTVDRVALAVEKLRFTDETTAPAFDVAFEQARLEGSGLSTEADRRSEWTLQARSDAGEAIKAAVGATVQPLAAGGRIELAGVRLPRYQPYVAAGADLVLEDGTADLALGFQWSPQQLKLDDIALALLDARARVASEKTAFLRLGKLEAKGASFDLAARRIGLGELDLREVAARLHRGEDGILNVARIARPTRPGASPARDAASAKPWTVDLARASLEGSLGFEDRANGAPVKVHVAPIALAAQGLSTAPGQPGKVSLRATVDKTGTLAASGPLQLEPLSARLALEVSRLALAPAQPYIDHALHLAVTAGTLSAKGALSLDKAQAKPLGVAYRGSVGIADFASVDKRSTQDLLKWRSLAFTGVDFDLAAAKLSLGEVALADYYARIIVSAEGRLNLQDLVVRPEEEVAATAPATTAAAPVQSGTPEPRLRMRIGKVALKGGNVNFSDFYIRPNYSANLTGVGGSVTEMNPERAGDVDIRGRIDNAAPVEITGRINPLAGNLFLDMKASARDIELAPLSPYSVKYAGYGIERGKLSLSVAYHIEDRKLDAQNQVYLDQLTFGDPVESPTATKLPVTLAVALLKDRNGVIDINLPVSGSLDDPEFSVFGVIVRVIGNLLVKAATAPFALLGSLLGGGEELSYLEFAPGSAALEGAEPPKLGALAKALAERPGLKLEVTGRAAPEEDREGLRRAALHAAVRAQKFNDLRRAGKAPASADEVVVEPAEYEKYLRAAYAEAKLDKPRNALGLPKTLPAEEMEALLLANAQVGEDELRLLANARAQAAKEWLVEKGKIAADRVFIIAPRLSADGIKDKGRPTRVDFSLK